jgi:hypothetical protein
MCTVKQVLILVSLGLNFVIVLTALVSLDGFEFVFLSL